MLLDYFCILYIMMETNKLELELEPEQKVV